MEKGSVMVVCKGVINLLIPYYTTICRLTEVSTIFYRNVLEFSYTYVHQFYPKCVSD